MMFTLLTRKGLNLIMAISLLIGAMGIPSSIPASAQGDLGVQYTYDANGNITIRTDASGATTRYTYDANNRMIAIRYPDLTSVKFTYNSLGQRTSMTDSLGTTSYGYDIHSRLVKITDPNRNTLQYTYDPHGLLAQMIYPDGSAANYTWDTHGQLAAVQDISGITSYKYDLGGKLTSRALPNGVNTYYLYDNANRLTGIQHVDSSGALLAGYKYELDALGNHTQMTQMGPDGNQVTHYQYDSLNRLSSVANPDGEMLTYKYDKIGNITTMNSSKLGETRYTYNGLGQLTGMKGPQSQVSFKYDNNGNLLKSVDAQLHQTINYKWDFENRLVSVDNSRTKINYGYDGNSSLAFKSSGGTTSHYLSDPLASPGSILAEYDDKGKIGSTYLYGNALIGARNTDTLVRFNLEDGFGSVGLAADARGLLIKPQNYQAYSKMLSFEAQKLEDKALDEAIKSVYLASNKAVREVTIGIPFTYHLNTALTVWDLLFKCQAIWFTNHSSENLNSHLPKWIRVPDGPDALRFTPITRHLTFAWDLIKGPQHPSFQITTTPINSFYDDGFRRIQTSGYQTIEETYSSTAPGPSAMRNYGYDPMTDSWTTTTHTVIYRTETSGYGRYDRAYEIPQVFSANPQNTMSTGDSAQGALMNGNLPLPAEDTSNWPEIKRVPIPPNWPNGGGGGAAVGGVSLDKVAQVLVNLNDITGASFDPKTGQVTLIGKQDLSLPPMNMDDLVVAIRSIYGGCKEPGMTMEPVDTTIPEDPTQWDRTQKVKYFCQTQNTHFGQVMFEADRYLKNLAAGQDSQDQPVTPNVPGYKSEFDLMLEKNTGDVPWHRNWFVPGEIVLKKSPDGHAITFDQATIKLESHFMIRMPDGTLQDDPSNPTSPVTDQFTSFISQHYDEFAKGKPELAELVQLAKIVGFVRWLHDNNIPVDLSWVDQYHVKNVDTPLTTPGVMRIDSTSGSYSIGGVKYSTKNTYLPDTKGVTDALAKNASNSRPADFPPSWKFDDHGETLTAVAFNITPTQIMGGNTVTVTDLVQPARGGQSASFTRQYNSRDLAAGPLGNGWLEVIPALTIKKIPAAGSLISFYYQPFIATGTAGQMFEFNTDGFFHPAGQPSSYEKLGVASGDPFTLQSLPDGSIPQPSQPGQPVEILDAQKRPLEYSGFAFIKQDGSVLAFDPNGRLTGQRDPDGRMLQYTYSGEQLSAIADAAGHSLQFSYDTSGLLTGLTASDGRTIRYTYDASRNLAGITDETGAQVASYTYDTNGRLDRITDQNGRVSEIAYDGLGRVVSSTTPSGSWTTQYDNQANTIKITNANGGVITRQYDNQNRLLSEADPMGKKVEFQYDEKGQMTALTDRNGNKTTFSYDESSNLAERVSPQGEKTIFWRDNNLALTEVIIDPANNSTKYEYDERGRLTGVTSGLGESEITPGGVWTAKKVDPQTITYGYDAAGNLANVQDPAGSVTHYSYDDLGNVTSVQLPDGGEVRQTFDDHSRLTSIADATGFQINIGYTRQGQLELITTPAGQTQYQYTNGLVTAVTDPLNRTTQYGYDAAGHVASVTEPDGSVTSYTYDDSGNLVTVQDALGKQTQFQYDAAGRVTGIFINPKGVPASHPNTWLFLGIGGGAIILIALIILVILRTKRRYY